MKGTTMREAAVVAASYRINDILAVQLSGVSKVYRLYGNPREQVADSLGLWRLFGRRRPQFKEFYALRDVNLKISRGQRVGIIGRNGAGKTTLLKLITGNFSPTVGTVSVNGNVQALMQTGLGFHPEFSGYENIRASLNYNGLTGAEFDKALEETIDFVELGDFLHQPMKTYSLGMNARVQFAAATAIRPDILIVDEILGAGDAYFSGKSSHRMQVLTSSGCTLLLVSHATAQVLQFCEDAIWLDHGQVRMTGTALDVVKAYEQYIEALTFQERSKRSDLVREPTMDMHARGGTALGSKSRDPKDYPTPNWQRDQMAPLIAPSIKAAEDVEGFLSRWPALPGLKIRRVEVCDERGETTTTVKSGQPITVEVEIEAENDGDYEWKVSILLMTLDGVDLTRHLSPQFRTRLQKGQRALASLRFPKVLLARGDFVYSAALFKHYDADDSSTAIRYDLLSRSFRLTVLPPTPSEPALFHMPSEWNEPRVL
jgi:lipopolysaccharide transport system ATP-binding protein